MRAADATGKRTQGRKVALNSRKFDTELVGVRGRQRSRLLYHNDDLSNQCSIPYLS